MNACNCVHPPAGATTLVVALGLLHQPRDLCALLARVAATALAFHRVRGVDFPVWSPRDPAR